MRARDLIVLDGASQALDVAFRARVAGTSAGETVRVLRGGDALVEAGADDAVRLPGALDAYDLDAGGNQLTLTREDGTRAVISLNAPVDVRFDGGAATARVAVTDDGPGVRLGDVPVDSAFDADAVELREPDAAMRPAAEDNRVFLADAPGVRTIPFDARVTGTAAAETVRVPAGADVELTAGRGDRVELPGALRAYTVSASGNRLVLENGETRASVALNALTPIAFADGTATANIRVEDGDPQVVLAGRTVGPDGPQGPVAPDSQPISSLAGGFDPGRAPGVGASGEVFVAGEGPTQAVPGSARTLTVGREGVGRVSVAAGDALSLGAEGGTSLLVGALDGSDGRVDLRGPATELTVAGATTAAVGDAGTGILTVRAGATASMGTLLVGQRGTGEVRVAGSGSALTLAPADAGGFARVGAAADSRGVLTITQGGTVSLDAAGGEGPNLLFGRDPGSLGALTVSGAASALELTRAAAPDGVGPTLTLGAGLGRGTATVDSGGSVRVAGPGAQLLVGTGDAAASTAPPTDTPVAASELTVGAGGRVVVAGPDAEDSAANAVLAIGGGRVGDGAVTVTGADARLSVEGAAAPVLLVGGQGEGDLTVAGGGRASARFLLVADGDASGRVTVEGAGSTLDLSGVAGDGAGAFAGAGAAAVVAGRGMASLRVRDGGALTLDAPEPAAPVLTVARDAGAVGTLTVRGADTRLRLDGPEPGGEQRALLTVGERGDGRLTVADGGETVGSGAAAAVVARTSDAVGRVTVEGEGSRLELGGELLIGAGIDPATGAVRPAEGGDATVVVGDGGRIAAGAAGEPSGPDIVVGETGLLRVAPDGAVAGDVRIAGGALAPAQGPAVTPIDGDLDHAGAMTLQIDGAESDERDLLEVTGEAVLSGRVTVAVDPAFAPQPGDSFPLIEADDGVTLADTLDVRTTGVPDGVAVDLVAESGSLLARFVDDGGPAG